MVTKSQALRFAFRVDSGAEIGTGHLMRSLTLANALANVGDECHFITRTGPSDLSDLIVSHGHTLHSLPETTKSNYGDHPNPPAHADWLGASWEEDARKAAPLLAGLRPDWVVVDHYALDASWEQAALPADARLLVIDDLADRAHVCDILLDQNLGRQSSDYDGLVPDHCKRLIGSEYALLRPEFHQLRQSSLQRRQNPKLEHILITMGGIDKDDVTSRVLDILAKSNLPRAVHITAVMGANSPALVSVRKIATTMPIQTQVLVNIDNMAEIMASADLAIGAAGSTSWERCCLGLPTLIMVLADNQKEVAVALENRGAAVQLGSSETGEWQLRVAQILADINSSMLLKISRNACAVVDGEGVGRCLRAMRDY